VLAVEQSADDRPSGLAAGAGDHDPRQGAKLTSVRVSQLATVLGSRPQDMSRWGKRAANGTFSVAKAL